MAFFNRDQIGGFMRDDGLVVGAGRPSTTVVRPPTDTPPITVTKPTIIQDKIDVASTSLSAVAGELWDAIKNEVKDLIKELTPQTYDAEIYAVQADAHYDVFLLTDPNTIIHNITSQIPHVLRPGDRVTLQSNNNNINTAIIIEKKIPTPSTNTYSHLIGASAIAGNSARDSYLYYDDQQRWWFIFSNTFYDRFLVKYMKETPQYDKYGAPIYETDATGAIVYDENGYPVIVKKRQAALRVGISRVMSQRSGSGRAHWSSSLNTGSRKKYSIPEYIGGVETKPEELVPAVNKDGTPKLDKDGNQVYITIKYVNRIRCSKNFKLTETDCGSNPIPMIEITDIVNNFIFCDDYDMRRSARRDKVGKTHYAGDVMFKQHKNYGYWFKRFGIYIKNNAGIILYVTPENETYTVQVHEYYEYRRYGISNLRWLGGTTISLDGELTGAPYVVKNEYIVWKDSATAITVGDASKHGGSEPYITATLSDSSTPFVVPNSECIFNPALAAGKYFESGKTYTITVRGKASLTTTAVIPAA